MTEWYTYTIQDFLMYSPRTWQRLVERYNGDLWPLHLLALGLGLFVLTRVLRPAPAPDRAVPAVLAAAWAWVAVAFLWQLFAAISTGARWFAAAFMLQALLLAVTAARGGFTIVPVRGRTVAWAGLVLLLLAVAWVPLMAPLTGRGPSAAHVFAMMPDPTALGTLGVLLAVQAPWRRVLLVIPVLWCAVAGATAWTLGRA